MFLLEKRKKHCDFGGSRDALAWQLLEYMVCLLQAHVSRRREDAGISEWVEEADGVTRAKSSHAIRHLPSDRPIGARSSQGRTPTLFMRGSQGDGPATSQRPEKSFCQGWLLVGSGEDVEICTLKQRGNKLVKIVSSVKAFDVR